MSFDSNLAGLSALPAPLKASGNVTFHPEGITVDGYLYVDGGEVSNTISQDLTVEMYRVDGNVNTPAYVVLLDGDALHLNTYFNFSAYAKAAMYSGSGDGSATAKTPLGAPTGNFSEKDGDGVGGLLTKTQSIFDGENYIIKVNDVEITRHTFAAGNAPTIGSGNMRIISYGNMMITKVSAFEYIDNVVPNNPTQGDSVSIFGSFTATQDPSDTVELAVGGNTEDITANITSWSSTQIDVTINTTNLAYGVGQIKVTDSAGNSGGFPITFEVPTGSTQVIVQDPIKDDGTILSLFDGITDTIATNYVLLYNNVDGLIVNANGTYSYSGALNSIDIVYQIYSQASNDWSAFATRTVNITQKTLVNIENLVVDVNDEDFDLSVDVTQTGGNFYIVVSESPVVPTLAQMKAGVDSDGLAGAFSATISATTSLSNYNISGIKNKDYTVFVVQEISATEVTNTLHAEVSISGIPVFPVITTQPISGTVQESISVSSHVFTAVATDFISAQYEIETVTDTWEPITGQNTLSFDARGTAYNFENSPYRIRLRLDGEGGVITYSNIVTLTVSPRPYVNLTIPNLPDGDYTTHLYEEEGVVVVFDGDVTFTNGEALNIITSTTSGKVIRGDVFNDTTQLDKAIVVRTVST